MDERKIHFTNNKKDYASVRIEDVTSPKKPKARRPFLLLRVPSVTESYQSKKDITYEDDLVDAVAKGNYNKCSILLEKNEFRVKFANDDIYSFHPVLLAAMKNFHEILELLLDHGANINITDDKGCTALHLAAQQRSSMCCNILLDRGINYSNTTVKRSGDLPIHSAANEGLIDVVKRFLSMGVDPNVKNLKNQTPVHMAASKGHDELLSLLLNNTPNGKLNLKDNHHQLPLHHAASNGHYKCCRILLLESSNESESHLNEIDREYKSTPLILAAKEGHARCCEVLSGSKVNIKDSNGKTALHYAAKIGFTRTINVLLGMNPDVNIKDKDENKAIHVAATYSTQRHRECLQCLFEYSCKVDPGPNKAGQGVVAIAALNNCTESFSYILSQKLFLDQINEQDKKGKTPLHLAIQTSNIEVSKLLLALEIVKCNIKDLSGNIPLHVAASKGLVDICKELLQNGRHEMAVNARNLHRTTPLHFAASSGSATCCRLLLQKNADLHSKDNDGYTAFLCAVSAGQTQILKAFLKEGKFNQMTDPVEISGDSPLHLAAKSGSTECVNFLLSKVKKIFITKCNEKGRSCLDEAFHSKKDNVFQLILSKWPNCELEQQNFPEKFLKFEDSLHDFMHLAISQNRRIIQDAIIESHWWYAGFSSDYCDKGICLNLRKLTKENPEAAEKVFDKCEETKDDKRIYNFKIFEDSFYIDTDPSQLPKLRMSAFDENNHKLKKDYKQFSTLPTHLLNVVIEYNRTNLLQHPVTRAFLDNKWNSYLNYVLYALLMFEILIVASIATYLGYVWNMDQLHYHYRNFSHLMNDTCSEQLSSLIDETGYRAIFLLCFRVILLIFVVGIIVHEAISFYKLGSFVITYSNFIAKICRLIGIFIMIVPSRYCVNHMLITTTWQWQVGVVTVLVSWYLMMQTLNKLPIFSVFMPITVKFIKSFIKVLFFIILILCIYVFIFFLLFHNRERAFENLWVSFMKSTVWVLGDFAYDDMFLNEQSPVMYPIMSNIIFLIFVTSISGFIVNLIITQPERYLDSFKNDAAFYKISTRIQLTIKYDSIFSYLYKKKVVSQLEEKIESKFSVARQKKKRMFFKHMVGDNESSEFDALKDEITIEHLAKEIAELKILVSKLLKANRNE